MRTPGAVLGFALAVLGAGVPGAGEAASQPTPNDSAAIAKCVAAAQDSNRFAGSCVGVVADPCIEAARSHDAYVEDAKACAARELAVWLARMQKTVKAVKDHGGPKIAAAVTAAQNSWAASRDKLCPVFENLDPGVSLGAGDYCRLQETARRDLVLEWLAAAVTEH